MAGYYNHRWLGDAEEQRPLQPAHLHPQQLAPPGAVIYSHPPGAYYTAPDHNYPHVVVPLHRPNNTSSSSSSSSSSSLQTPSAPPLGPITSETTLNASYQRGGRVTPPVSAPSAYAHNPEDLFRTPGSDGHYPQQFGPAAGRDEYEWQVQQRERNARVIQQQRAIKESNHKHFPLFLLLASVAQCAMMAVEVWKNGGFEPISVNPFFGPSVETLIYLGAKDVPLIVDDYEVWRFFTPIFLHAGLIHLALNLIFQLQCIVLERQLGFVRVALIYIVSGFGGNLASSLFLPRIISVGASGALFGLVGTIFVVLFRNWSLVQSPCRSLVLLCIMIAISLFLGLLPNVDNFAHVGGFVTGFVASLIIVPSMKPGAKAGPVRLVLASVALLALAAGLGLGVYALFEDVPLREWCSFCSMINCVDFGQDWCDSVNNPT